MDLKVIVICRNELRLSNDDCSEKTHFLNIQSNRFRIANTEQPINLIDLNMNVQDKFHFVDSVLAELIVKGIVLPNKETWLRGCLVIEAGNSKFDIKSDQFFHIYSDFHTTL